MAATHPFPRVPYNEYRIREEDPQPAVTMFDNFGTDWSNSHFRVMARMTDASIDLELLPEPSSYRHGRIQRCLNSPERRCSIDAPMAWHSGLADWHGGHSPLQYGLDLPHYRSSESQWTPIDQESNCSGGSTWSPTSNSRSEADGYRNHPLSPKRDGTEFGVSLPNIAAPLCFLEDLSCHSPACATVIAPHALQQYPDPEDFGEDTVMRPDLRAMTTGHTGSSVHPRSDSDYDRPAQSGQDDKALGSSLHDEPGHGSTGEEEDSIMGDSLVQDDDDDDYSPTSEKRASEYRLSAKATDVKNSSMSPKRSRSAKNAKCWSPNPTKVGKKPSARSSASCTTSNRITKMQPCTHCSANLSSESALKKHVLASHTRPFICTFRGYGCSSTVGSKNEWKRHINVQHMHLETWRCDIGACAPQFHDSKEQKSISGPRSRQQEANGPVYHDFDRKDLFTQHLKRMHSPASSASRAEKAKYEASVEAIQTRCHRRLREPPTNTICPYCTDHPAFESWDDRIEHVGKHLERGDFNKNTEREDIALREWLREGGYLVRKGRAQEWNLLDSGKKRKKQREEVADEEDGERDADGEEE